MAGITLTMGIAVRPVTKEGDAVAVPSGLPAGMEGVGKFKGYIILIKGTEVTKVAEKDGCVIFRISSLNPPVFFKLLEGEASSL